MASLRSHALRRLAPGPWRSYDKHTLERALLITAKRDRYGAYLAVPERYFEAAKELEVEPDGGPPDFFISEQADCRAAERLVDLELGRERPLVAIAPGAAHATKRWPHRALGRAGAVGSRRPARMSRSSVEPMTWRSRRRSLRAAGGANVGILAGALGLQETGAVIRRSEVLISGDTGVMHMATGVGTPVVALFGPTVRQFGFFPYRSRARASSSCSFPADPAVPTAVAVVRSAITAACGRSSPTSSSPPWPRRSHERLGPGGDRAPRAAAADRRAGPGARASSPSGSRCGWRRTCCAIRPPSGPIAAGFRRWSTGSQQSHPAAAAAAGAGRRDQPAARRPPETAVQVLSQLVAPARESGGADAGDAVAHAARAARAALRAGAAVVR